MKKVISFVLMSVMLITLGGCSTQTTNEDKPEVKEQASSDSSQSESAKAEEKKDVNKAETAELDYPKGTINMIVPANAGSLLDIVSRDIANMLDLGEEVIITNRGGAGQTIGAAELAMAKGDGYTLGVIGDTGLLIKPIQMGLSYSADDFRYLGMTAKQVTNMLVASPMSDYKSWDEVIEAAKAGKEITYTTGNAGSMSHLAMIQLMKASGVELKFIPFNGSGEVNAALAGGHVDLGMLVMEPNLKKAAEGQVIPIVTFTEEPVEQLVDVPTSNDYNLSHEDYKFIVVLCVPKDTPDEIFNHLKEKADVVFTSEAYIAARQKMGSDGPQIFTEAELTEIVKAEGELIRTLSEEAGLIQ